VQLAHRTKHDKAPSQGKAERLQAIVQTIEFLQPHGNTIFLMSCFFMTNQTQAVQMIPLFLFVIISIAFQIIEKNLTNVES
jgi:hypothetical protein